ncbi:hypothetical protein LWI28_007084 [Acer negundo]|uniref:Reverse transcriptase domain-containing protein n=1 Tax=Acer negundo TaxID=4023 RepID=A0AAD5IYX1_ACENE|nr:hypothetical protein LWI28_007084 [Acer negundo]
MKFSREEIKKEIFYMNPTKALGCDGLPAVFFQKYWESIGPNVVDACLSVLNNGGTVDGMNKTIIALIPKIQNPVAITNYSPINLCNVIYKAIAKAMTNKLKHVLGDVISATQCAFIPGRLILDNTIVGFESLHMLKQRKRKRGSMAIKLDMSKAYDRVEWAFLDGMMRRLVFSMKWVDLVMGCVSLVSYSICINGEVCGNIKPSRVEVARFRFGSEPVVPVPVPGLGGTGTGTETGTGTRTVGSGFGFTEPAVLNPFLFIYLFKF